MRCVDAFSLYASQGPFMDSVWIPLYMKLLLWVLGLNQQDLTNTSKGGMDRHLRNKMPFWMLFFFHCVLSLTRVSLSVRVFAFSSCPNPFFVVVVRRRTRRGYFVDKISSSDVGLRFMCKVYHNMGFHLCIVSWNRSGSVIVSASSVRDSRTLGSISRP